jgi:peptide/nickel transport system permease protein
MLQFLARRLFSLVLVSIAIVYFGFLGMALLSRLDDEASDSEGSSSQFGESVVLAGEQTVTYFAGLLGGDMGTVETVSSPRPVSEILWFSYRNSMGLVLMAVGAASVIGLLLGTYAGLKQRPGRQYTVLMFTLIAVSAPAFLVAVLLQTAGIKYTVTFGKQLVRMGGYGWDLRHIAMPLIVLSLRPLAYITRATFVSMGQIMQQDYIRTAFAKGLTLAHTTSVHAFRNLAVPFLTAVGVSFRFAISILPLVEFIFAWPGLGLRILEAINNRQPVLVVSIALILGLTIQLINIALDASYRLVDPRLREPAAT